MIMVPGAGFRVRPMALRVWMSTHLNAHWFRTHDSESRRDRSDWPCVYRGCGRPGSEHWSWCGEWMLPRRERWTLSMKRLMMVLKRRTRR